jgi:hypothetical protein
MPHLSVSNFKKSMAIMRYAQVPILAAAISGIPTANAELLVYESRTNNQLKRVKPTCRQLGLHAGTFGRSGWLSTSPTSR